VLASCSETEEFSNGSTSTKRVGYARVSTQGQSLEQQLAVLTAAGCAVTLGEKVSSTAPSHRREALLKALDMLKKGDTLVVAKLDRLGRTQSEVVARLIDRRHQEMRCMIKEEGAGSSGVLLRLSVSEGAAVVERVFA